MSKRAFALFLALLAGAWAAPLRAQKLPEGRERTSRERDYDLRHLRAELVLEPAAGRIEGRAVLTLEPLRSLDRVRLDAIALEVSEVRLDGAPVRFLNGGRELDIGLPASRGPGDELHLAIDYHTTPRAGMYFQPDRDQPSRFWISTYGEGGLHANWLPIYAAPNDKLTSEMIVTVPAGYSVISNGRLVSRREESESVTWHWSQERPHSDYLIVIYAGDYERGELRPAFGEVPLAFWVPRGRLAEGAYAFRNTTRMVEFFSERLDYRYPWAKYDQIVVPDYPIGAMEHTGATGHDEGVLRLPGQGPDEFGPATFEAVASPWSAEATISHELAHHWFGDELTCTDLSRIWLNESFASYLMMLWDEEALGSDQLLWDVELARRHYFASVAAEHVIRPLEWHRFDSPDQIYDEEHTYLKGAAVLHQLRRVLGDEPFFRALALYLHRHAGGNVVSEDLEAAIRDATGRNLDWYFADWVTGGGHPILEVSATYRAARGLVDLEVLQVQAQVEGQGLFRLPVKVRIDTPGGSRVETVRIEKEKDHFLLPSAERPTMVSFDGTGDLVAEIRFEKKLGELAYQARHDALPGRLRALEQLADRFPGFDETAEAFSAALAEDSFWALRAEAARLLGGVRTRAARELLDGALAAADDRVRKGAALALGELGPAERIRLRELVESDPQADVAGTALVALARVAPDLEAEFLARQMARPAWYDELRLAALEAMKELERPDLLPLVRSSAGTGFHHHVRLAALEAWEAAAPDDPELHASLLELLGGPWVRLQSHAVEALGRLAAAEAIPELESLVEAAADENLVIAATEALEEIRRVAAAAR